MAQSAAKREESVVDPMFYIPEGVDELVYSESSGDESEFDNTVETEFVVEDAYIDDGSDYADYSDTPAVPEIYGVLSQTLRTTASGQQVVDLVLDVEDVDSIVKYEVRVTKI